VSLLSDVLCADFRYDFNRSINLIESFLEFNLGRPTGLRDGCSAPAVTAVVGRDCRGGTIAVGTGSPILGANGACSGAGFVGALSAVDFVSALFDVSIDAGFTLNAVRCFGGDGACDGYVCNLGDCPLSLRNPALLSWSQAPQ